MLRHFSGSRKHKIETFLVSLVPRLFHRMSSLNSPCPTIHDLAFSVASKLAAGLFAM